MNLTSHDIMEELFILDVDSYVKNAIQDNSSEKFATLDYVKMKYEQDLNKIRSNTNLFISGFFHTILTSLLFDIVDINQNVDVIYDYINSIVNTKGGFKPSNKCEYKWQHVSRLYSTYYSLMLLRLIDDDEYLRNHPDWCLKTYFWICEHQILAGNNEGAFAEPDAPSSIVPEITYWAIRSLMMLKKYIPSINESDWTNMLTISYGWINNYIKEKKNWSITRLYYALLTIITLNKINDIKGLEINSIIKYIDDLYYDSGYHEFNLNKVKARYRQEKSHNIPFIHSTSHAIVLLNILGKLKGNTKIVNEAKQLVKKHRFGNGYGIQITIKDYNFGPIITSYEVLCALFILYI